MKISVIIPTMNRVAELYNCIKSLESQTVKPDEIIIIGHPNDKETRIFVHNLKTNLNIIYLESDGGTCKARNLGINKSGGDVIVFLDDDVILHKDYIKSVKDIFKDKRINIVTGYTFDAVDLTNPLFMRRGDVEHILKNPNDEFVKIIRTKVFHGLMPKYHLYYSFIKALRDFVKSVFLLEWPIKGKILPSGYRSEMPDLKKIKKMKKVEWVFGNNFAARREVLNEFKFNEDLERHPYAINEDLEFSARAGKKYDIFISSDMIVLHLRSPKARRLTRKERLSSFVTSTYLIAKSRGNKVAHLWAITGLLFGSIIKLPFSYTTAISELKGIIEGIKYIKKKYKLN